MAESMGLYRMKRDGTELDGMIREGRVERLDCGHIVWGFEERFVARRVDEFAGGGVVLAVCRSCALDLYARGATLG